MRGSAYRTVACALVLGLVCGATPALATPTITEFAAPNANRQPLWLTAGPGDGNVWFLQSLSPGYIGKSSTAGLIEEFPTYLSGNPLGITSGPDGDLWFAEPASNKIGRATTLGSTAEFSTSAGSEPAFITAGPDGNLWFTESGSTAAIGRITTSGTITTFNTGLTAASEPLQITAGPDGNLWFTEGANPGRIGRITPAGVITEFTTGLTPNSRPEGITAGPDGNLWFTESANPGRIGRITPAGVITEFTTGLTPNAAPRAITAGNDGNLYFTEPNTSKIGEITPAGVITERATPSAGSSPEDIITGPDGNLWFTEHANPGRLAMMTVAPKVAGQTASAITEQTASLGASVGPNSQATSYRFEYGPTSAYGSQTAEASAGAGAAGVMVAAPLSGLTPGTTYHFRAVATNSAGTTAGPDQTLTTVAAPSTASSALSRVGELTLQARTPPAPPQAAPPALGRTATARALAGTVLIRLPGTAGLRQLGAVGDIPVGALVDASHGRVELTVAVDRSGHTQSATLWGASFVLRQTTAIGGATTFVLAQRRPRGCGAGAPTRKARAAGAHGGAILWASDHHGRFSTRGQNSVATVRGTIWGTTETCAGTLTIVRQGAVGVRSVSGGRTVVVRAGHSYLARP